MAKKLNAIEARIALTIAVFAYDVSLFLHWFVITANEINEKKHHNADTAISATTNHFLTSTLLDNSKRKSMTRNPTQMRNPITPTNSPRTQGPWLSDPLMKQNSLSPPLSAMQPKTMMQKTCKWAESY